jgi:hypothetical protein
MSKSVICMSPTVRQFKKSQCFEQDTLENAGAKLSAAEPNVLYHSPMPDIPIKAFLSCSFSKEDRSVVEIFRRLLSALEMTPDIHAGVDVGPLAPEIQERIKASDCVVAIATRRDRLQEADHWTFSDWVHDEITTARSFGKPVAIFLEDGVQLGGSLKDVRHLRFNRHEILEGVDRVVNFLFNLRAHVDQVMAHRSQLSNLKLLRDLVEIRERYSKTQFSYACQISMQSLVDELPAAHHSQILFDGTPGLSVQPLEFSFACEEAPVGVSVLHKTLHASERSYAWAVTFDPPLKQQQRVRYGFRFTYGNDQPFTLEELQKRILDRNYPFQEPRCRVLDWTIFYPTRELNYEGEFPQGYPIHAPKLEVRIGSVGQIVSDEEQNRILADKSFVAERVFDTWRTKLRIRNPIFGHNYAVSYVPPNDAEVAALNPDS